MTSKVRLAISAFKHRRRLVHVIYNYLFFRENGEQTLWGSISEEDRTAVARLSTEASAHQGPIIEIGTLFGLTAQLIATHKVPGQKVISIDNYCWNPFGLEPGEHRDFTRRVLYHYLRSGEVELYDGSSAEFFRSYQGPPPALVFIDGDHEYAPVRADIQAAQTVSAQVIAGHDYSELHPGVMRAVKEAFAHPEVVGGTVWVGGSARLKGKRLKGKQAED